MTHIPGPWKYLDYGSAGVVITSGKIDICLMHLYRQKEKVIANAELIIRAPEMQAEIWRLKEQIQHLTRERDQLAAKNSDLESQLFEERMGDDL